MFANENSTEIFLRMEKQRGDIPQTNLNNFAMFGMFIKANKALQMYVL